jgi:hypothetical protein
MQAAMPSAVDRVGGPGRRIANITNAQTSAVANDVAICRPSTRFPASPQFRRSIGKNASEKLERPRRRRTKRIRHSARTDCTRTCKYIAERKSCVSVSNP